MVNKDKEIVKLNKRVSKLEKVVEDFMKKWGPASCHHIQNPVQPE